MQVSPKGLGSPNLDTVKSAFDVKMIVSFLNGYSKDARPFVPDQQTANYLAPGESSWSNYANYQWVDSGVQIIGSSSDDGIVGSQFGDQIDGGKGNDIIYGTGGNDTVFGGDGDDWMSGGADNDYLAGGAGADLINGDDGNDRLFGGSGNDILLGGSGDDLLVGGTGADQLKGGSGNDFLFGDSDDYAIFDGSSADYSLAAIMLETGETGFLLTRTLSDGSVEMDRVFGIRHFTFADGNVDLF